MWSTKSQDVAVEANLSVQGNVLQWLHFLIGEQFVAIYVMSLTRMAKNNSENKGKKEKGGGETMLKQ